MRSQMYRLSLENIGNVKEIVKDNKSNR